MTTNVTIDADLCCEKLSESMYIIGNEPTLACYRIQEHIHKSGPMIIDKGTEMRRLSKNLQGCCYGLEYSVKAIKSMEGSLQHFQNLQELLKNSLFIKQQLDYETKVVRLRQKRGSSSSDPKVAAAGASASQATPGVSAATRRSAFQRFSGSFDFPSLPTSLSTAVSSVSDKRSSSGPMSSSMKTSPTPIATPRIRTQSMDIPSGGSSGSGPSPSTSRSGVIKQQTEEKI